MLDTVKTKSLKEGKFMLDKKKFFIMRAEKHCKRLSWKVVDVTSLKLLKVKLNGDLSNLVQW